ncbi:hypothetical protein HNY73_007769 [Argiope bruennichi]|uniref:BTB domain-containing protein n=1 Tax=Argiope bruennichi TaxID=94029 RepID=A0A8T0FKH2_ARGBR|nr:hypothetical protein HNY73_007769 [Argiope bruennichi]
MEFIDFEAESCVINTVLEIRIEDFRTASELVGEEDRDPHPLVESIYAAVYPNGIDEETEGWLVVLPDVDVKAGRIPVNDVLSWIVSVIDVEGNPTLPRSFEGHYGDFQHEKYLERSFILDRADELLADGALTLHCDIYFAWNGDKDKARIENGSETENSNDAYTIYDFTHQILTLPQFHELRKSFGVHGIAPSFSWPSSRSEPNSKDILEHVWTIDTHPDRFLLFLDEKRENVGSRLMKASPFITRCASTPLKKEKRIELCNVDSETFVKILFFIEKGMLPPSKFDELVHVYKISHLCGMKELQEKCSEQLVKSLEFPTDFEELERIAYLYSDEHLSTLLDISCEEDVYPLLFGRRLDVDGRLDSKCYI